MLTLTELLEETREAGLELLTGPSDVRIRTAYISELPDPRRYLAGDELILTNGLWHAAAGSEAAYVSRLRQADVAALGFGLTRPNQSVPEPLLAACRYQDLPLIRVPVDVSFAEIIDAVVRQAERTMQRSLERSEALLRQAARGGGPAAILRVLAREREVDAWLMVGPYLIASAGRPPRSADIRRARQTMKSRGAFPTTFLRADRTTASMLEVKPVDGPLATLVYGAPLQGLSGDELEAIRHALPLLAVELTRRRTQRDMERRYAVELFELLLSGEPQLGVLKARLRSLGLAFPLCAAIGLVQSQPESASSSETLAAAEELADLTLDAVDTNGVTAVRESELLVLLEDQDGAAGKRFVDRLQEMVQEEIQDARLVYGFGARVASVEALRSSFIQARYAARSAQGGRAGSVADWTEVTSYRALLETHPPEILREFADAVLAPLVAADGRRNSELLLTLRTFFESGRRSSVCSEALHIHPNTLRHRLARIETLTNRSLSNLADQVDLFLALDARTRASSQHAPTRQ